MELARVFAESGIEFDATLVFMTVAGEEQGLVGAGAHAKKAKDENIPIQAWFNNDIVGGLARRRRHHRRRDDSRLLGGSRGFAVAIAGDVRAAHRGAVRAVASRAA